MNDYFDDEDLINDYIEDDFDEPLEQEIPEEYLTDAPSSKEDRAMNKKNIERDETDENVALDHGNGLDHTKDLDNHLTEDDLKDVNAAISSGQKMAQLAGDDIALGNNKSIAREEEEIMKYMNTSNREKDLYKFQRFTDSCDWRKVRNTSDNRNNRKRKHEIALKSYRVKNRITKTSKTVNPMSAAAVQLVQFAQYSPYGALVQQESKRHHPRYTFKSEQYHTSAFVGKKNVPITLQNKHKIHVSRKYENHSIDSNKPPLIVSFPHMLLDMPMSTIKKKADILRKKMYHSMNSVSAHDSDNNNHKDNTENSLKSPAKLWVDKHAPSIFSHLLSDERTNREVLRCLREWDPYVFRRDAPARPEFVRLRMEEQQQQRQQENNDKFHKNKNQQQGDSIQANTDDIRPHISSRVVLLCGPPGVGKTTLANIIAKHAGYQPVEINASDDRTKSILSDKIIQSMGTYGSLITKNAKPNCLILDEVDGISDKSTMNAIINIIKADLPLSKQKLGDVGKSNAAQKQSRPKKSSPYLRRPLIFIANHKFAPVVRALLPYAKVFDVAPPSEMRLVSRLKTILTKEKFAVNSSEKPLVTLVRGSGGDIRSCVHTLQFTASGHIKKGNGYIKNSEIRDGALIDISKALLSALGYRKGSDKEKDNGGWKDERADIIETLMTIFRKAKQTERFFTSICDKTKTGKDGVEKVLQVMESFNDASKIIDILFMNVPNIPYIDPALDRSSTAHEWLSAADILRSNKSSIAQINMVEHLRIQRLYIPSAAAAVHLLCRVETKLGNCLNYSTREMYDMRYKYEANSSLLDQFIQNLPPQVRNSVKSNTTVVIDLLPYAMWLLSAGEGSFSLQRAVSSLEILNEKEKNAFWAHVKRLRALGLTYVKVEDDKDDGFLGKDSRTWINQGRKLRLEPEVDQLVSFTKSKVFEEDATDLRRQEIPSALKELLAHGVSVEAMKEKENILRKEDATFVNEAKSKAKHGSEKIPYLSSSYDTRKQETKASIYSIPEKKDGKRKGKPEIKNEIPKAKRMKGTFLGIGAARAREAKSARNAAIVGFDRSRKLKMSYSGSNIPLSQVIRFKYQKGFTQAVRIPCKMDDFL